VAFELGVGRYDEPPPDRIDDIEALHARGAFRFANQLRAWVEVENGKIVGHGHEGRSLISRTILRFGALIVAFQPTAFPDIRWVAAASDRLVRFIQTAGGRAGVPAPRRVRGRPYFMWERPNVWTTLSLTMRAQGPAIGKLEGASRFPRHWVYDSEGRLVAKSRSMDFTNWYRGAFGRRSPWGDREQVARVMGAESEVERQLSTTIMRGGAKPRLQTLPKQQALVTQGKPGSELYLLLDGVLEVDVDGRCLGQLGPGAVVGERAAVEGGLRTATLRAVTDCRVAVVIADQIDPAAVSRLTELHRREEAP